MLPSRLFEQSKAGLIEGVTVMQRHPLSQPVSSRLHSNSVAGNKQLQPSGFFDKLSVPYFYRERALVPPILFLGLTLVGIF